LAGFETPLPPLLPAEMTTTAPAAFAWPIASMYSCVQAPPPPRLMLITRAGLALCGTPGTSIPAAHRRPAAMSESNPPHLPSTRTGMTLTPPCDALAMPTLLFVTAPIRPSVCVPCHELFVSSQPSAAESAALTKSPGSEASASRASPSFALLKSPGASSLIMS
jgi:hypothetical protein